MEGFITEEDLDAWNWYESKRPLRLGNETGLEKIFRITGLNQLFLRPSDEEILRMYRGQKLKEELRKEHEGEPIYDFFKSVGLKGVADYLIDISNIKGIKSEVDHMEEQEKIALRTIITTTYGR